MAKKQQKFSKKEIDCIVTMANAFIDEYCKLHPDEYEFDNESIGYDEDGVISCANGDDLEDTLGWVCGEILPELHKRYKKLEKADTTRKSGGRYGYIIRERSEQDVYNGALNYTRRSECVVDDIVYPTYEDANSRVASIINKKVEKNGYKPSYHDKHGNLRSVIKDVRVSEIAHTRYRKSYYVTPIKFPKYFFGKKSENFSEFDDAFAGVDYVDVFDIKWSNVRGEVPTKLRIAYSELDQISVDECDVLFIELIEKDKKHILMDYLDDMYDGEAECDALSYAIHEHRG